MTLIDDNVGSPATGTIDDREPRNGIRTQRRRPPRPRSPTRRNRVAPSGRRRRRVRAACGSSKRSGALEPVDVNKIVNAIARASEGLLGVDPMRVATRTISALADGASTRELDDLSIRTAAGLIVEEPTYSKLASRLLATVIDKEVRNQNIPWFSESIKVGHAEGLVADNVLAFVEANAPSLNAAINSDRDRSFEFFGLRTVYDRYLLRHPERREIIETPQYFFLRVACGLVRRSRRHRRRRCGGQVLRPDVVAGLPPVEPDAVQLRHVALADVELLPARLARGQPRGHLQALHRHRQAVEVRRRHRRRLAPGAGQGQPDHRHQRPVQRHRAVAAHARLVGRRGQPGRPPQGCRLRVPRVVARRHRGLPRAARQHRRPRPPHAQPEHRQLDPRPVHGAGREGLAVVAVRSRSGSRTSPTCTAPSSSGPTWPPRRRACTRSRSRPASSTRG